MTIQKNILTIILAAGKGTRMKSAVPKVLHRLGGLPMLGHVLNTVEKIKPTHTALVLSPDMLAVEHYAKGHPLAPEIFYQPQQLGTAHAVLCVESRLQDFTGPILVLFGDTPLIRAETLEKAIDAFEFLSSSSPLAAMVVGMMPSDAKNYGRLILDETGKVVDIVEAKNASPEILAVSLCNSGMMILNGRHALSLLRSIEKDPLGNEYYLTDVVRTAHRQGYRTGLYKAEDAVELEGINSRSELAWAEAQLQRRWRTAAMDQGVTLVDPESVYFSYDTQLSADVTVHPHVFFGPSVKVESSVEIMSFTHLEGTHIKTGSRIGPYARLRPGTIIGEDARIGNFVELKNTTFASRAKAGHLSYIGDAEIGEGANIGAGTITCNYDGYTKWQTKIGRDVLVGANSSLVAPLVIGDRAVIGAGTTVTKNVAEEALTIGRSKQVDIAHGGKLLRERKKAGLSVGKKETS